MSLIELNLSIDGEVSGISLGILIHLYVPFVVDMPGNTIVPNITADNITLITMAYHSS